MFIQVMLVLIFLILVYSVRILYVMNENVVKTAIQSKKDNTEMILLTRGIKSGTWSIAERDLVRRN